jgi:carbonic anhydrase
MTDLPRRRLITLLGVGLVAAPVYALAEGGVVHGGASPPSVRRTRRPRATAKPAAAPTPEAQAHAPPAPPSVSPDEAMDRLMRGNARFAEGYGAHPNSGAPRRVEVAAGQRPFATILACADSRAAPELIFDQGLGDLFVVRVAGNVVDDAVLASIEYSVIHLGSTLIMALGHERCGAVKATIEALAGRGDPHDRDTKIGTLAALIAPAVRATPPGAPDPLDAAVSLNAAHAAGEILARSPPLRTRVLAGSLKIVAARYDLDDGRVTPTRT